MSFEKGIAWLCDHCAGLRSGEKALVLCNPDTLEIARHVYLEAVNLGATAAVYMIPDIKIHGCEPPEPTAAIMFDANVIFCFTKNSLAHSQARLGATQNGARYLSLPDYSRELVSSKSLLTDFQSLVPEAEKLTELLDKGREIHVTSEKGTDIRFSIDGRMGNCTPGIARDPGTMGSPPDSEVNIAPIETSCEGVFVVDGSIPCAELGILKSSIKLTFKGGRVVDVNGEDQMQVNTVTRLFEAAGPKSRILGEFGLGLNPNAELCGIMLVDEGVRGTIHLGIGSNATIGGTNDVAFHIDFVMNNASVNVDRQQIMTNGDL